MVYLLRVMAHSLMGQCLNSISGSLSSIASSFLQIILERAAGRWIKFASCSHLMMAFATMLRWSHPYFGNIMCRHYFSSARDTRPQESTYGLVICAHLKSTSETAASLFAGSL